MGIGIPTSQSKTPRIESSSRMWELNHWLRTWFRPDLVIFPEIGTRFGQLRWDALVSPNGTPGRLFNRASGDGNEWNNLPRWTRGRGLVYPFLLRTAVKQTRATNPSFNWRISWLIHFPR
jgi:hypothetical protein